MNIFLLGNGFDLHHDLPTNYFNFLNTVNCIKNEILCDSYSNVGEVFGDLELHEKDEKIKYYYEKYSSVYKSIEIDADDIRVLRKLAMKNDWFEYMSERYRKNVTWIDFEQEISRVCKVFDAFFAANRKRSQPFVEGEFFSIFKYFDLLFSVQQSRGYQTVSIKNNFLLQDNRYTSR